MIQGEGSPRRYSLAFRFLVDSTAATSGGFSYRVSGHHSQRFEPLVPLSALSWFTRFRTSQASSASFSTKFPPRS